MTPQPWPYCSCFKLFLSIVAMRLLSLAKMLAPGRADQPQQQLCHCYMYDHESVPYSAVQSIADVCCQALSPEVVAASQASIVVVTSGVIIFACGCGPLSVSSSVCEMRMRPRVQTS